MTTDQLKQGSYLAETIEEVTKKLEALKHATSPIVKVDIYFFNDRFRDNLLFDHELTSGMKQMFTTFKLILIAEMEQELAKLKAQFENI